MKKNLLFTIAFLICVSADCFAQKLEENKVDDFTKKVEKSTSWETFVSDNPVNAHFRISLVDTSESFDMKLMLGKVFSIEQDAELMLKLANGDIVTLKNLKATITCTGCGATGFNGSQAQGVLVYYPLSKDQVRQLKASKVVKVRITTLDGSFDDDVKDKNADKIIACLNLL